MARIGIVCPYAWDRPGGVQTHLRGFLPVLRRSGFDCEVLAPVDGETAEPFVVPGGRSTRIYDNASDVPVALSPAAIARAVAFARSPRFDLLHVHEPAIPWLGLVACFAARVSLVGTFHMYSATPRWYVPFAPVVRPALGRLAVRIAVSEAARRHVARTMPGDYRIVPNGIDYEAIAAVRPRREGNRVLFIGRPEPRKGLPMLLRAFAKLPADTILELAGPSADDVSELPGGAGDRIRAHGFLEPDQLHELLGRVDVLCVPSLQGESFGIVLLEGMAAGLPVVASDVPGYGDVMRDCGRLVPPGDPDAVAGALRELLADPGLRERLGKAGRERAREFDWSRVGAELIAIYEEVLERRSRTSARAGRGRPARREPPLPSPAGGGSRRPARDRTRGRAGSRGRGRRGR